MARAPVDSLSGDEGGGGAQASGGASAARRRAASKRLRWNGKPRRPSQIDGGALIRVTLSDGRPADEPGWSAAMSSPEPNFGTAVSPSTNPRPYIISITILYMRAFMLGASIKCWPPL